MIREFSFGLFKRQVMAATAKHDRNVLIDPAVATCGSGSDLRALSR